MFCDYEVEEISSGGFRHTCRLCGDVQIKPVARYRKSCRKTPSDSDVASMQSVPSLGRRIANFTKAAIAHALRGAPTCSDQEIARRHAICRTCELYRPDPGRPDVGICAHPTCGCGIHREAWYLSKLAWADQACPLGKWGEMGAETAED
jgi:hypothetical protein